MTDISKVEGVDFHCYVDLYPDHAGARAETARIYTLTVTTTPSAWSRITASPIGHDTSERRWVSIRNWLRIVPVNCLCGSVICRRRDM